MGKARLSWGDAGLRLEGVDGAANVIHLQGPPAARLAHLSLHRVDLEFTLACLTVIEAAPREQWHTPAVEAAWRSALLHYCKCFAPPQGGIGRTHLSATKILGPESGEPMKDHRLMMTLRNKHLVHDEGTHNWVAVAALIAPAGSAPSVLRINVAAMDSVSLDQLTVPALRGLAERVLRWVRAEFDRMGDEIAATLMQSHSHAELLARERELGIDYRKKQRR